MKFLIDAHLPMQLVYWLRKRGHNVVHTRELPLKNETDDVDMIQLSVEQDRIVVSKDADFYKYLILKGQPYKLLMLTMGNIVNKDLLILFKKNIDQIETDLEQNKVVALGNDTVTVHF